jgi:hypothetical protein
MCFSLEPAFLFSLLFKKLGRFIGGAQNASVDAALSLVAACRIEGVGSLILDFAIHNKYMYVPTEEDLHMDG